MREICFREIPENTKIKKSDPKPTHENTFNHENPEEASSISVPLNNNMNPANVHTAAASKSSMRFETLKFNKLKKFTLYNKILTSK